MTDMIERVARAIDPRAFDSKFCHEKGCPDCDDNRDAAMGRARAAIDAMREPTAAMWSAYHPEWSLGRPMWDWWRSMIDAALGEGGK